jgi:aa3 type cytochrome c oxidase subunit IV
MSDYKHGAMDVSSQEKTFEGFVRMVFRVGAISIGVLIFLALFNS